MSQNPHTRNGSSGEWAEHDHEPLDHNHYPSAPAQPASSKPRADKASTAARS